MRGVVGVRVVLKMVAVMVHVMAVVACLCAPALSAVELPSPGPSPNFVHPSSPSFFTPSQRHAGRFLKHLNGLGRVGRTSGKRFSSGIEASWIVPPTRRWIQESAGLASSFLLGSKASSFCGGVAGGVLLWKCVHVHARGGGGGGDTAAAFRLPGTEALRRGMQQLPSVASWFCSLSSAQPTGREAFNKLPSVVSWHLPNVFLQKKKREILFEVEVDGEEGKLTYSGLAVDATEFGLYLTHALPPSTAMAILPVTNRYVDIEDKEVRAELRQRWGAGRMVMKNISYKDAMAEDRSFLVELKSYLKKIVDFTTEKMEPAQIREWLGKGYGDEGMQACCFDAGRSIEETRETLLPMLHWFRHNYPYYHQACFTCGNATTVRIGNTRSNAQEQEHISGRTELVYCEPCKAYSRFARYSSLAKILEVGKGRCGEYSTAFYHLMRALGYRTRWVVDWTDHVWVEVEVQGEWMHIDPCEAAFNDKRMYIGWGKKHTYVIAFSEDGLEDVTAEYADDMAEVAKRRELSAQDVSAALEEAQDAWVTDYSKALPSSQP